MLILRDNVVSFRLDESHSCSTKKVGETKDDECHCGLNVDLDSVRHKHGTFSDMLLQLKGVAIDPSSADASSENFEKSWHQILIARKLLSLSSSDCPQKKRKLEQLLREKVVASSLSSKKPNVQNSKERQKSSLATSSSCLISNADSVENSGRMFVSSARSLVFDSTQSKKGVRNGLYFEYDALDMTGPQNKEALTFSDSDDSVSGSNLLGATESVLQNSQRSFKFFKTGDTLKMRVPGSQLLQNPDGFANCLKLASRKAGKHQKSHRSAEIVNFDDETLRMSIPVGPRFQADIPDWTGRPGRDISLNGGVDSDGSEKWLGTRIWPDEGKSEEICMQLIGKGRKSSCSCRSPGSISCIKHHITENRLRLKLDLGSAFFSWRFDNMGEEGSKSWTMDEQKAFEVLVKTNPVSKNMSFWRPALKRFLCKSRERIVGYYYNVFVLRRMSRQTRLACTVVDSDDDEANETVGSIKNSKARYLTGLR